MQHGFERISATGFTLAAIALVGAALLLGGCTGDKAQSESLTPPIPTASGAPDTQFATAGIMRQNWSQTALGDDRGFALLEDAGGSLVVGGYRQSSGNIDWATWRIASSGFPDISYDTTGFLMGDVPQLFNSQSIFGAAIQSDGNLIFGGEADNGTDLDGVVWRVFANGSGLDTTFQSTIGFIILDGGFGNDSVSSVAMDANRIIAVGYSTQPSNIDAAVWRVTAGGTLDPSFNTTGELFINNPSGNGTDTANAVAVDNSAAQPRYVVAGTTFQSGRVNAAVWRILFNGTLDTTFGTGGLYMFPSATAGGDAANAVSVDNKGQITVAGAFSNGIDNDFGVFRLSPAGALDTTFGLGGLYRGSNLAGGNSLDEAYGLTIDSKGNIIVTGSSDGGGGVIYMTTVRLTHAGVLDPTFGVGGIVKSSPDATGFANGEAVIVDHAGRIVVAGHADFSGGRDMTLWRYK